MDTADHQVHAPIALFAYNRPWHLRKTVEALKANDLSGSSNLIVYSDGPKDERDERLVNEVRRYIDQIEGFKHIEVIKRNSNWGLAENIIDGVTDVVNQYGRIIVLEDDLVTSPYFLKFMNDALDIYEDEDKVMNVCGYMFPVKTTGQPFTWFYRGTPCWGWATWKRAWNYFDRNVDQIINQFSAQMKYRFNLDGKRDFWRQLEMNKNGEIRTWAIFWYASVFLNGGLSLMPSVSLVSNIGGDMAGTHCQAKSHGSVEVYNYPIKIAKCELVESEDILFLVKRFFTNKKQFLFSQGLSFLRKKFGC